MCGLKPHNRNKKIKERKTEEKNATHKHCVRMMENLVKMNYGPNAVA